MKEKQQRRSYHTFDNHDAFFLCFLCFFSFFKKLIAHSEDNNRREYEEDPTPLLQVCAALPSTDTSTKIAPLSREMCDLLFLIATERKTHPIRCNSVKRRWEGGSETQQEDSSLLKQTNKTCTQQEARHQLRSITTDSCYSHNNMARTIALTQAQTGWLALQPKPQPRMPRTPPSHVYYALRKGRRGRGVG